MDRMGEPINILLVDDDEDCRLMIRDAIEEAGVKNNIYEVSSGKEALDFIYRRGGYEDAPRPGLIYLDIDMPGISGQEVLRAIKSDERYKDIPVVMMTGLNDDREKLEAAKNGANSYTVKPSDPVEFMRTIIEATNYWIYIHQRPNVDGDER
jgi:two-component system response regulator